MTIADDGGRVVFDELLAHERRYWKSSAEAQKLDPDGCFASGLWRFQRWPAPSTRRMPLSCCVSCRISRRRPASDSGGLRGGRTRSTRDRVGGIRLGPTVSASISLRARSPMTSPPSNPAIHSGDEPALLAGVLQSDRPERLVQPLDLYARAAPEHPKLARDACADPHNGAAALVRNRC